MAICVICVICGLFVMGVWLCALSVPLCLCGSTREWMGGKSEIRNPKFEIPMGWPGGIPNS